MSVWQLERVVDFMRIYFRDQFSGPTGGSNRIPTLSVNRGMSAEFFGLHFESSTEQLSIETAIAILCDLARRAEQPLRHLL